MKDLSVVVVSHGGWKRLVGCLNSLSGLKGDLFSMEVIVVDNSSDPYINDVKMGYPQFRFIHNRVNGGFANGCNLGASHASGEFMLFLNPDTVVDENGIWKLLEAARSNRSFHLIACRQVDETGKECRTSGQFPSVWNLTGIQRSISKIFKSGKADLGNQEISFPDWVAGSVMMINREIFHSVNGFDEDFWMYYEDVDICRRISNTGGKIAYFRDITIEHNHGGSTRASRKVTSITKTEVLISQHVYVNKHFKGVEKYAAQIFLVLHNMVVGAITALFGIIFFFIPALYVRTSIFAKLVIYYTGALQRMTWTGVRSIKVRESKQTITKQ